MKRLISFTITLFLPFLLFGCDKLSVNDEKTVVFYYIHNEIEYGSSSGVITSNVVNIDTDSDNYEALLELYFNGPTNYECISPFAAGTTMVEFGIDGTKAQILLSPHMATLRDSTMTVALACLTRTIVELTGAITVQVRIQNNKIFGEDSITLSLKNFNYFDDISPNESR